MIDIAEIREKLKNANLMVGSPALDFEVGVHYKPGYVNINFWEVNGDGMNRKSIKAFKLDFTDENDGDEYAVFIIRKIMKDLNIRR